MNYRLSVDGPDWCPQCAQRRNDEVDRLNRDRWDTFGMLRPGGSVASRSGKKDSTAP